MAASDTRYVVMHLMTSRKQKHSPPDTTFHVSDNLEVGVEATATTCHHGRHHVRCYPGDTRLINKQNSPSCKASHTLLALFPSIPSTAFKSAPLREAHPGPTAKFLCGNSVSLLAVTPELLITTKRCRRRRRDLQKKADPLPSLLPSILPWHRRLHSSQAHTRPMALDTSSHIPSWLGRC